MTGTAAAAARTAFPAIPGGEKVDPGRSRTRRSSRAADRCPDGTTGERPPPQAICVLLPVWGDEYITQFLEQSLPTLLAPGNIPALARALPTRFVFLSRAGDETTIRTHPAYRRLRRVCDIEILPIDDLITQGNHSTTVTLAYARAVRQAGDAMLDTCFFFLVSDYIMADGSLAAVLTRMQAGASAVQVGNFQLDEETAEPWLLRAARSRRDRAIAEASRGDAMGDWLPSRDHRREYDQLIRCATTLDANRLLWRVDAETLIGRFYLLHMICIRPEIVDFVVGSSCDYSFVPEMCPSGNVVTITDSDDYLVVEIQPDSHESNFLRLGPTARSMSSPRGCRNGPPPAIAPTPKRLSSSTPPHRRQHCRRLLPNPTRSSATSAPSSRQCRSLIATIPIGSAP